MITSFILAAWLATNAPPAAAPFTALRAAKVEQSATGVYGVPAGFSPEAELLRGLLPGADELWERVDLTAEAKPRFAGTRWSESWAAKLVLSKWPKREIAVVCASLTAAGYEKSEASCRRTIEGASDGNAVFANRARRMVVALQFVSQGDVIKLSGVRVTRSNTSAPPTVKDEALVGGLTPFERVVLRKLDADKVIGVAASRGAFLNSMAGDAPIDALRGKRDFVLRIVGEGREPDGKRFYERYQAVVADIVGVEARTIQDGVAAAAERPGLHVGGLNDLAELRVVYARLP